nr:MAG TPA: hypothetical protein [Bacteriophage sp.]
MQAIRYKRQKNNQKNFKKVLTEWHNRDTI